MERIVTILIEFSLTDEMEHKFNQVKDNDKLKSKINDIVLDFCRENLDIDFTWPDQNFTDIEVID